ncbi:hypothetical protein K439DRAFT_1642985 [Ramaria rubella]|nr:hypothetical protein K439DRAFT_1642985 [Ramaria rubella]
MRSISKSLAILVLAAILTTALTSPIPTDEEDTHAAMKLDTVGNDEELSALSPQSFPF